MDYVIILMFNLLQLFKSIITVVPLVYLKYASRKISDLLFRLQRWVIPAYIVLMNKETFYADGWLHRTTPDTQTLWFLSQTQVRDDVVYVSNLSYIMSSKNWVSGEEKVCNISRMM